METEKVVIEAEVKVKGEGNVKSIKAELRQLKNELGRLDPDSQAFITAAQRAGVLQDQIEDINNTVKAFNPEAKFQAFAGVLGGVANGFSAIQGAQALFGAENEDVQKAILKTQGAIALATGLNGLMGMKDAFTNLALVIKTNVVSAFATMRAAIISTGIIGLVALIGGLIYAWYEESKANEEATKSLEDYNEAVKNARREQQDLAVQLLEGRTRELAEITNETTKKILELNDKAAEIRKKAAEEGRNLTQAELVELESYKEQQLTINEIGEKKIADLKEQYRKEDEKKTKEQREKETAAAEKHAQELKTWRKDVEQKEKEEKDKRYEQRDDEEEEERIREERRLALQKKTLEDRKKITDAKIKLAEEEKEAQLDTLQATAAGINAVSQLVGEQTAAGKALGVASATIDTYVGANKALAQGGTLGFVAAGAVILQGLANVKRILAVKVPSINGTSANAMGNAPSSVPQMPNIYQSTQLNPNSTLNTRQLNVNDNRVYVLESDITGTQKKVERITRKATIR
jgi:hypothetical protein